MAQTLSRDAAEERLRWLRPYLEGTRTLKEMAAVSPFAYRTLKRWARAYHRAGTAGLAPGSRRPHHHPRQYTSAVVARVRSLRQETKLGPDVLAVLLRREGLRLSHSGIGKLLHREGFSRQRTRLQKKEWWIPRVTVPGELVEIDVVYVRKFRGQWLYQFTALDCCTRWRHCWATPEQSNASAVRFLHQVVAAASFRIRGVKTDNASIFTNRYTGYAKSVDPLRPRLHFFDRACAALGITHYLIAPGKPQQNGKVERSHRTDRERFWNSVRFRSLPEIRRKHAAYVDWYNRLCPHLGLGGLTPYEKLHSLQGTNVRV